MAATTKILDCTFRDGGHLNDWRFDPDCVRAGYHAARTSGVAFFEAGYRFPPEKKGLGPFAYCHDDFLLELLGPASDVTVTVMADAGKCEAGLFGPCRPEATPVRGVRVATYPYELPKAVALAENLHAKGYAVFMNLMAFSELAAKEWAYLRDWPDKGLLSAIYFADSFGAFIPEDIVAGVARLRDAGFRRIGFHAHNNLQLSFANTLRAMQEGAVCVDASIYGMGRGAGNLPVEILVGYMEKSGHKEYNAAPYLDVIERYFLEIFRQVGWGYSIESLMGGLANIHPYYVESLFARKVYTTGEIWNALRVIKERCPISFSPGKLDEALQQRFYTPLTPERAEAVSREIAKDVQAVPASDAAPEGRFALENVARGRTFLVMANGPSIVPYRERIRSFVEREQCVTIGVNNLQGLFEPDYHIFISRKRFQQFAGTISPRSVLLVPSFFGPEFVERNYRGPYHFFDVVTSRDPAEPPLDGTTQRSVALNVAISAMLLASLMGAGAIHAVGMDGYAEEMNKRMVYFYNDDNAVDSKEVANLRYEMLARELERVSRYLRGCSIPFSIITPTSHKNYYRPLLEDRE